MKRLVLLFGFFLMTCTMSAQENQHLDFKDVPIDGNISSFVHKMEEKGFVKHETFESGVVMKGTFVGKEAELYILKTPKTNTVWKVAVYIDKDASWYKLKRDYYEYVELFKQKYGDPDDHFEFFSKPYYEGDGYELQALKKEKCNYYTYFKRPLGTIVVNISTSGEIRLCYEDTINSDKMSEEKRNSALDDI